MRIYVRTENQCIACVRLILDDQATLMTRDAALQHECFKDARACFMALQGKAAYAYNGGKGLSDVERVVRVLSDNVVQQVMTLSHHRGGAHEQLASISGDEVRTKTKTASA